MTHTLDVITYSCVVTRLTVHIALAMATLHDLKVTDILSAYVMTPNRKKICTVLGPEFGDNVGKSIIIVRVFMVKRVQVPHLGHILHNVCRSWGTSHAIWTLTYG